MSLPVHSPARPLLRLLPLLLAAVLAHAQPVPGGPPQPVPGGAVPAGPAGPIQQRPDAPMDATQRAQIIATLATKLRAHYVFPDVAERMAATVQANAKRGDYDKDASANAFCAHLMADLRDISRDKHLQLRYTPERVPEDIPQMDKARAKPTAAERDADRWRNYGVEKVERLPGNIGYLELTGFLNPQTAGDSIAAAMTLLAEADALIIDLRRNGGGDPATVALLTSYLFDGEPVHLNDLHYRWDPQPHHYWTQAWVPGKRFGGAKPVYVLTSGRSFSAAEEFSYNLKALKRATLVGATTGGGANPGDEFKLAEHVKVFIPTGRAVNPITQTNWEGVGVVPDVAVPTEQALLTAQLLAMKPLLETTTDPFRKAAGQRALADMQARLDAAKAQPQTQPQPRQP